jgi:hypothetical protein
MGGSRRKQSRPEPKPEVNPMLEFLKQQQVQQNQQIAESSLAQEKALLNSQVAAGNQSQMQGQQMAMQDLGMQDSMQSIRDANSLSAFKAASSAAGQQATGGGFDVNSAQQNALANMGYSGNMLPKTPANMASGGQYNPTNTFSLPQTSGIKFGGV